MAKLKSNPLEKLLDRLSGPWTMYILCILDSNGDLRRQVAGISPKVLTERLRMLEEIGVVERHYKPTIPPQVTYELTVRGRELAKPLYQLYHLALKWYGDES
jgi:DNA-binding HxlR family transcriptional regulator